MTKRNIITLCLFALGIVVAAVGMKYVKDLKSQADAIYAEISGDEEDTSDTEETTFSVEPEEFLAQITENGNAVIALQNQYEENLGKMLTSEGEDLDAILEEQETAISDMQTYFKENASGVQGWYTGNGYNVNGTWQFASNYTFTYSVVDCLWTCVDEDTGNLLCYVKATYDVNTGLFGSATIQITNYGYEKSAATLPDGVSESDVYGDSSVDYENYAQGILDMIESNNVGQSSQLTEEQASDLSDAYSARDALQQQYGGE